MATCKQCGKEYSIWSAAIGTGKCKACCDTQELSILAASLREREKQASEQVDKLFQPEAVLNAIRHPDLISVLSRRYSDAYTQAHAVVGIGNYVKRIGVMLGGIFLIGVVMAANAGGRYSGTIAACGFALACLVCIPTYVLGILVAAQGQITMATLDAAVNSSRHLQDDDVARILSKRFSL